MKPPVKSKQTTRYICIVKDCGEAVFKGPHCEAHVGYEAGQDKKLCPWCGRLVTVKKETIGGNTYDVTEPHDCDGWVNRVQRMRAG